MWKVVSPQAFRELHGVFDVVAFFSHASSHAYSRNLTLAFNVAMIKKDSFFFFDPIKRPM